MAPTRISQKPVVAVAVAQKVATGYTQVSQKTGTPATAIAQKPITLPAGWTEVSQK